MANINPENLLITSSLENTFAKILVMATGVQVSPSDMDDLQFLYTRDQGFWGISLTLEAYMNQKLVANDNDLHKTLAQVLTNATGDQWNSTQAADFYTAKSAQGITTWTDLFAHLIENPAQDEGAKLDSHMKGLLTSYGIDSSNSGSGVDSIILPVSEALKFVNPSKSHSLEYTVFSNPRIYDEENNLIKSFNFEAPKVLFTQKANIFDFSGGDKVLAVSEGTYESIFGYGKDTFFLNFSKGDKVIILDTLKNNPLALNENQVNFYNEIHKFGDEAIPYQSIWNQGDSLIDIYTSYQPNGKLISFPSFGVPSEISTLSYDAHNNAIEGINYRLNLKNGDMFGDGDIILVGSNSTLFNSENFIFNSPEYSVF